MRIFYKNVTYYKVTGFRKFIKGSQNLIDCAMSTTYTIYAGLRIYHAVHLETSDKIFDTNNLPDADNT